MLLAWQARRLKRVVKNTLTAETLGLQEAIEVAIMMFRDILDVDAYNEILPINHVSDSKLLDDSVNFYWCNFKENLTETRLKVELYTIRESLEKQEIHSVIWVWSEDQLSVCFTNERTSQETLHGALIGKLKLLN